MSDRLLKESAVIEAFKGRESLIHDVYTATAIIRSVPSADRPQGEWIDAEIPLECGGSMPIQVCSLCKTFYPLAYTGGGHRFCPNCGAKMKGADDE